MISVVIAAADLSLTGPHRALGTGGAGAGEGNARRFEVCFAKAIPTLLAYTH